MMGAREESDRLHRARRAAELAERDRVLTEADTALARIRVALARALLAAQRGRYETPELIAQAAAELEQLRLDLRAYYDRQPTQGT